MTEDIYLLIGSNEGDRRAHIQKAIQLIGEKAGPVRSLSGIYETAPWGKTDQAPFLNQAVCIHSTFPPRALLQVLKEIEKQIGRVSSEKWGPRIIDIDILFYGHEVVYLPDLVVPHPYLPGRRFALMPLSEIAAPFIHPFLKKTVAELLQSCPDTSEVVKL